MARKKGSRGGSSDPYEWWGYQRTTRRKATGGIQAKSKRGDIGETWWSKKFITLLEDFGHGPRMSRGRSYARSGQVMDLKIVAGQVSAKVQGSQRTPYRVTLDFPPLKEAEWRRVEAAMADQAIFLAKLLAGEMPQEIEDAFKTCGLALFPTAPDDLETDCSCPDWSNPCKHIAATFYILAEQFDADPFLIFAWRGRTKDALLERLRALRGAAAPPETTAATATPPLSASLDSFWQAGPALATLAFRPHAAEIPDALLRQRGPLRFDAKGPDLRTWLTPLYAAMVVEAERLAYEGRADA